MDFTKIESKWQKIWDKTGLYEFDTKSVEQSKKFYLLEMFSYPSNDKLHLGHWWNFGLSDSYGRYKMMKGYQLFHTMGFDSFGLPAENYAIKTGIHPNDSTYSNIRAMEKQLKLIGASFDWDYSIRTSDPEYYKWTQWLFLQLYKKGKAYQKYSPVNWCSSCNTVLANEQVVDSKCERCGSEVEQKKLTQWFLKISDYSERLLKDLDKIDWPEKTKALQRNWIGKSEGSNVVFETEQGHKIKTFTSRVDTLHGVTWVVLAPEHDLVDNLVKPDKKQAVARYIEKAVKLDDMERQSATKEKTGVFTGSYAINPINNENIPVYVGDYVIGNYGTGAVMGVPAHDERDFTFAKKYDLPIKQVIQPDKDTALPYTGEGYLINSAKHSNLKSEQARQQITKELDEMSKGKFYTNYKLRDWSISRQRYWGSPIPIIHCKKCGALPVDESDLPVELPYDVDWTPTGRSPLSKNLDYMNAKCPKCGGAAKRDPDTLDTFVCSSWYFLRYPSANNTKEAFNKQLTNKILPVDKYVGGIEHATGHLLYSRFITKFLYDEGYLNFDEPFKSLLHQGMILGEDGTKMGKRKGNAVNPDALVNAYGSDSLRLYLMFGFNYQDGGPWDNDGIKIMHNFLKKVFTLTKRNVETLNHAKKTNSTTKDDNSLEYRVNYTIKQVDKDFNKFGFNTSIARIMELFNELNAYSNKEVLNYAILKTATETIVKLLAPCIPHTAEELWEMLGHEKSIFKENYPKYTPEKLVLNEIEIAVQVNSKIVDRVKVQSDITQETLEKQLLENLKVKSRIAAKKIVKKIYIKNRLINFIVK